MAEATAFRNNALPYPVYAQSWTVVAPLLDADGDPISPSSPDSEVSKNGDTFADCTNEATEIATSSGVVYLTLTAAEMTADIVTVRIQSTGAKTTIITLYPRKLAVLSSGTCQGSNDTGDIQLASGDSAVDDIYNGCLCVAVIDGTTEARIINDYVGSTKVGEVSPAWNTAQPDSNDTYTIYLPEGRSVDATNVVAFGGTAGTFASGRPEVNSTHWAGSAITATSIPVATAAGASGGLLISGSNSGTTTLGALTVTGTTTLAAVTTSGTVTFNAFTVTNATTLSGAVSLGSTLGVTGTATFAAITTTGTVTMNALTVSNATTLSGALTVTGAITATNASNNITLGTFTVNTGTITASIVGNITGNLSGSVGSVTGNVTGSIGSLAAQAKADVNAEVVDVVNVDTLVAGKTIAAALKHTSAGVSGVVSGAGTGTEVFKDFAGSTSFTVTVDASGNRSVVVWA